MNNIFEDYLVIEICEKCGKSETREVTPDIFHKELFSEAIIFKLCIDCLREKFL